MARFMLAAVAFMLAPPAQAAEITAVITNALKSTLTELAPAFEKASEHKLNATSGSTEPLKARVERGLTGIYLWSLFARLGIADPIRAKYKDGSGAEFAGKGESEIGLTQASEVALAAGAELGGLLPTEIQNYTVFAGAIVGNAKQPAAGKALLDFLAAPETIKVMKAKGLVPAS